MFTTAPLSTCEESAAAEVESRVEDEVESHAEDEVLRMRCCRDRTWSTESMLATYAAMPGPTKMENFSHMSGCMTTLERVV